MSSGAREPEGNPQLLGIIRREIAERGRITFERFMELALYHPAHGYYSAGGPRIGPEGDYYTSTDVSPLFGATLGRQVVEMWELLGRPDPFHVVEHGAGKGLLAADLLGWAGAAHPEFYRAVRYLIVEVSPAARERQREHLWRLPVSWADDADLEEDSVIGVCLSNELADALPFHRIRMTGAGIDELWVVDDGLALGLAPGEPSDRRLESYVERWGGALRPGQQAEVNLRAIDWARRVVRSLRRGFFLTIDYGGRAEEVHGPDHPDGTLACYYRHTRNRDPLRRVGEQDITAHVNFSALAEAVREAGGEVTGYTTQGYFLAALGIGEAVEWALRRAKSAREFEQARAQVEELVRPDGLGGFKVLVAHKGLMSPVLRGLSLLSEEI